MKPWEEYEVTPEEAKEFQRTTYTSKEEEAQLAKGLHDLRLRKAHSLRFDTLHQLGIANHPHAHRLYDLAYLFSKDQGPSVVFGNAVALVGLIEVPPQHVLVGAHQFILGEGLDCTSSIREYSVALMRAIGSRSDTDGRS